jgi:hypothetical protein
VLSFEREENPLFRHAAGGHETGIVRDVFGIETQIIQHNGFPLCLATGKKD